MKKLFGLLLSALLFTPTTGKAQIEEVRLSDGTTIKVDRSVFPDLQFDTPPAPQPRDYVARRKARAEGKAPKIELPPYVNNGEDKYFPPIFNQDGGSCGSAQSVAYMFTHEMDSYRDLDASLPENQYPSHFTWLLTYHGSNKEDMLYANGVPNVPTYGGRTYSRLFGNQTHDDNDFGWMQGYDKWYSAMWNRTRGSIGFGTTTTPEGRRELKEWLYNHSGDPTMHGGGVAGIGVAAYGDWASIPTSAANREAGVVGKKYVKSWGDTYNHAVTVCGYDDRIEFDLDGDGKVGEIEEDEVGAWIIANSWGDGWENKGFIYCPYKYSYAVGKDKMPWTPGSHLIRQDYRPLRTIKLLMEYSRRSELLLQAGISQDINATKPEKITSFEHFRNAGNHDGQSPDPEVPMLGRWSDGLHYEPMEFGYDLTSLTSGFDRTKPLKYFFIVKTKTGAIGEGKIHAASIINYEIENQGLEIPFEQTDVKIRNRGAETIISVVVPGEQLYPASNLALRDGVLCWTKAQPSSLQLLGYRVYDGTDLAASLPPSQTFFTPADGATGPFSVCAYYQAGEYQQESAPTNSVSLIQPDEAENDILTLTEGSMTIPNAVSEDLKEATIEFWMRPAKLTSYIQQVGPGWGKFLFHTDGSGKFYAGWNTGSDRFVSSGALFSVNKWAHVAIVINGNVMTLYLNGLKKGSITSSNYSGLAGFGDLKFGHSGSDSWWNGSLDEIRVWKSARTAAQIKNNMRHRISQPSMYPDLLVYLPMDRMQGDSRFMLREWTSGKHATVSDQGTYGVTQDVGPFSTAGASPSVSIDQPKGTPTAGIPFGISASNTLNATEWAWSVPDARETSFSCMSPTLVFDKAGTFPVSCTVTFSSGETLTAETEVTVAEGTAPVASFDIPSPQLPAGDRFCFINRTQGEGCTYRWSMPGAEVEECGGTNATALYPRVGTFEVTLTATNACGESSVTKSVTVTESKPAPFFALSETSILLGDTIQLIDQSRYTPDAWQWELSNGSRVLLTDKQSPLIVPTAPGIYDVTLIASNALGKASQTKGKYLTVSNDDAKTSLNFTGTERLQLASPFAEEQKALTLEWWMRPQTFAGSVCLSSETGSLSTQVDSKGLLTVTLGTKSVTSCEGYIILNEWHHYGITYNLGAVKFYRDGQLVHSSITKLATRFPALGTVTMGSDAESFRGQIDEVRVWGRSLTLEQFSQFCNRHIEDVTSAENDLQLLLYYDFNQNGGDVVDRTSGQHDAKRIGFGPDGDAWNSALGVFTLDTEAVMHGDISADFLTNYKKPFITATGTVNSNNSSRFLKFAMRTTRSKWQDRDAVVSGGITTGVHIDTSHSSDITVETQWSGFSSTLLDYGFWHPVTLPAGRYTFTGHVSNGDSKGSRLVACEGKTMIHDADCEEKALAYCPLNEGVITFSLTQETEVSLGIIVNMTGQESFSMDYFRLEGEQFDFLQPVVPTDVKAVSPARNDTDRIYEIYDISGRRVPSMEKGVYISGNRKVLVK